MNKYHSISQSVPQLVFRIVTAQYIGFKSVTAVTIICNKWIFWDILPSSGDFECHSTCCNDSTSSSIVQVVDNTICNADSTSSRMVQVVDSTTCCADSTSSRIVQVVDITTYCADSTSSKI